MKKASRCAGASSRRRTRVSRNRHTGAGSGDAAFSEFINDESLTQPQIVFVRKVIDYVVQNGYSENAADLAKPPFDKPQSFMKLFDSEKQKKLVETVKAIKENAMKVV